MFNLDNGRVILRSGNSVFGQKKLSSLHSGFILNLYIVNELITWPRNYLLGTVQVTRNANKSKFTYSIRGITFDRKSYRVLIMTLLQMF